MMDADDTLPPEMSPTVADGVRPDPGPHNESAEVLKQGERCLFVKIPLLASVPSSITDDPDQVAGLCAMMETAIQDALAEAAGEHPQIFAVEHVVVAYDAGGES